MKFDARLKRLETNALTNQRMWVAFIMKNYKDPAEKSIEKQRLLDQYLAEGNPKPIGCVYWNEIVPEMGIRDAFAGSCPTNPLADMMERIAQAAKDPLEE